MSSVVRGLAASEIDFGFVSFLVIVVGFAFTFIWDFVTVLVAGIDASGGAFTNSFLVECGS